MDLINKHETPIKTVDLTDMTVLNLNKTKQTEQRKLTGRYELIGFQTDGLKWNLFSMMDDHRQQLVVIRGNVNKNNINSLTNIISINTGK